MFINYNPNPNRRLVGDCVIRAISCLTGNTWEKTYMEIALQGYMMKDMPSSNAVWGAYLSDNGYERKILPNTCPECYTVRDFCEDYPEGFYLLATGTHVVAVMNGNYYDTWDSGSEFPIYYWHKKEEENEEKEGVEDASVQ